MIIEKTEDRDGAISFEDKETKKKYSRIIGGLGWPQATPGFVVVVAEDFDEDPSLKKRHVRVLAEIEDQGLETLFQKSLELRDRYQVQNFYGNTEDKSLMEFWHDYNRDLKDVPSLWLSLAPFPEDFAYHARVIRDRLEKGEKKTLHFGLESLLPGYLLELSPEETIKATVYDHPAISSLGYVVSYLKSHPLRKKSTRYRRASSWKTV